MPQIPLMSPIHSHPVFVHSVQALEGGGPFSKLPSLTGAPGHPKIPPIMLIQSSAPSGYSFSLRFASFCPSRKALKMVLPPFPTTRAAYPGM